MQTAANLAPARAATGDAQQTQAVALPEPELGPLVLPQSDTPKWHFKFGDEQVADQIANATRMFGWQNMMRCRT